MEKNIKKKAKKVKEEKDEIIKMYELIKSKEFLQDLCNDALSDLNKKPSYIRLKDMVDNVINDTVDNYVSESRHDKEHSQTRTLFTRLSILTHTIDSIISGLLCKKLNEEIKQLIKTEIQNQLSNKGGSRKTKRSITILKKVDEIKCNGSTNETKPEANSSTENKETKQSKKSQLSDEDLSDIDKETKPEVNSSTENKETKQSKKSQLSDEDLCDIDIEIKQEANSSIENKETKQSKKSQLSDEDLSDIDKACESDIDAISLAGSDVSSVHTSDLSSFEDDIVISSEDEEGEKTVKRVSLKLVQNLIDKGELSELHEAVQTKRKSSSSRSSPPKSYKRGETKPKRKLTTPKKAVIKHSKKSPILSDEDYSDIETDVPSKKLPTRIRKPNSKYSSDDVICPIKNILSQADHIKKSDIDYVTDSPNYQKEKPQKSFFANDNINRLQQNSPTNCAKSPKIVIYSTTKKSSSQETFAPKITKVSFGDALNTAVIKNIQDFKSKKSGSRVYSYQSPVVLIQKMPSPCRGALLPSWDTPGKETGINKNGQSSNKYQTNILTSKETSSKQHIPHSEKRANEETMLPEEVKRKRGRPPKANSEETVEKEIPSTSVTSKSEENNVQIEHSTESFTELEERLCLKDKKNDVSTPPKSSTKSYDKSDLYKPHNDFRLLTAEEAKQQHCSQTNIYFICI